MKSLSIAVCILFALAAVPALAQEQPNSNHLTLKGSISPGEPAPTPEMWFYEQYRSDYQDPKMAVRKRAEFRADQRQRRLAALKWFGFSNQRPTCTSDPFHGDWSPRWVSNNAFYPSRWQGAGQTWIVVRPDRYGIWVR